MSFHEEFRKAAERRNSLPPWARPVVTRPMTPARPAAGDTRACGCRPAEREYCTDCDPDAFAGDTRTDRERLWEAWADVILRHWRTPTSGCECGEMRLGQSYPLHLADRLLALPEMAALLDAAEKDAEKVQRVEAWVVSMDDLARQYREAAAAVTAPDLVREAHDHAEDVQASVDGVRRALDGQP